MARYDLSHLGKFIVGIDFRHAQMLQHELGFQIDWRRMFGLFQESGELIRVYDFIPLDRRRESSLVNVATWQSYNRYTVVEIADQGSIGVIMFDTLARITLDSLNERRQPRIDDVVLVAGQSEYAHMVKFLQDKAGVRVWGLSSWKPTPLCSTELRRAFDRFIEVQTYRRDIELGPKT